MNLCFQKIIFSFIQGGICVKNSKRPPWSVLVSLAVSLSDREPQTATETDTRGGIIHQNMLHCLKLGFSA